MGREIVKPKITILDAIHCKANKEARKLILPLLRYETTIWKRGVYGHGQKQTVISHMITGRRGSSGIFLTGLLSKIQKRFGEKRIRIANCNNTEKIKITNSPKLKNIKFRPDQGRAIRAAARNHRGTILMPTGSGKTVVALGIMSMFNKHRILFLCHTIDLIEQTATEIKNLLGMKPHIIRGGHKIKWEEILKDKNPIVLATIQSFVKIPKKEYLCFFDITMIDEVHHLNNIKSQYGQVMINNLSPRRYGFTATIPKNKQGALVNEGLIGPPIAELTMEEGIGIGIIAKPTIKIIQVPESPTISRSCKKFQDAYTFGIVKNRIRNRLLINEVVKNFKSATKTTLIIIERTEHGRILQGILNEKEIENKFVYGGTPREERLQVKNDLSSTQLLQKFHRFEMGHIHFPITCNKRFSHSYIILSKY